jgi:hypothetical protein
MRRLKKVMTEQSPPRSEEDEVAITTQRLVRELTEVRTRMALRAQKTIADTPTARRLAIRLEK